MRKKTKKTDSYELVSILLEDTIVVVAEGLGIASEVRVEYFGLAFM